MLELPNLNQAALDAGTVETLFSDLATCTQLLSVVPKAAAQTYVAEKSVNLQAAREGLRSGEFRAVQVRYRFEGREWCDTIMGGPAGSARIVRICTDDVFASVDSEQA